MTGIWTGHAYLYAQSIGVQVLVDERDGLLTGTALFTDPATSRFVEAAPLNGSRKGSQATITTIGKSVFAGKLRNEQFRGTLTFPAEGTLKRVVAKITLTRENPVVLPTEVG